MTAISDEYSGFVALGPDSVRTAVASRGIPGCRAAFKMIHIRGDDQSGYS